MLIVSAKLNPKRAALYMLLLGAALVALILVVGTNTLSRRAMGKSIW